MPKKRQIYEGWFSIVTGRESDVEDRAQDKFGPRGEEPEDRRAFLKKGLIDKRGGITREGWDTLSDDIDRVERNAIAWLSASLNNASDEGHDDERRVGGFTFDAGDSKQMDIVNLGVDTGINSSDPDLDSHAWQGVSQFGIAILDVDIYLSVAADDLLKANAQVTWEQTTYRRRD